MSNQIVRKSMPVQDAGLAINEANHSANGSAAPLLQLFQMVGGYWLAQVVHVVAKLGIADHLASGPKTTETLANETGSDAIALNADRCGFWLVGGSEAANLFADPTG